MDKEGAGETSNNKNTADLSNENTSDSNQNINERMAPIIGTIEAFVIGDDFSLYKRRMSHFLSLNKITDNKEKIDVLASFGGADLYKILHSLIQPENIEDKTYEQLIEKLDSHFAPKKNIVAESFKFNKRDQKQSETIAEYIVELKTIAQDCEFGNFLDRALRDRFICGINNEAIQQKLLNDSSLSTFQKACDVASTMETTKKDLEVIHNGAVNFVSGKNHAEKKTSYSQNHNRKEQYTGNNNNNSNSSNAQHNRAQYNRSQPGDRRITCYSCGGAGHIAKFCNRKRQHETHKQ